MSRKQFMGFKNIPVYNMLDGGVQTDVTVFSTLPVCSLCKSIHVWRNDFRLFEPITWLDNPGLWGLGLDIYMVNFGD